MPTRTRKQGTRYVVQHKTGGRWRTVSRHSNRKKAESSRRAREAGSRRKR